MALYGDELMQAGLIVSDVRPDKIRSSIMERTEIFQSLLYLLKAKEE